MIQPLISHFILRLGLDNLIAEKIFSTVAVATSKIRANSMAQTRHPKPEK
jgi:hypothetical protein